MTLAILIEPLDLLFCRDGRPIVAGEGAAAGTGLPNPQVLTGAIRSALLRARGQLPDDGRPPSKEAVEEVRKVKVRGPLLADLRTQQPFIPLPADVVGDKPKHGKPGAPRARLSPLATELPGWQPYPDAPRARPLWPPPAQADTTTPKPLRHRIGELAAQTGFLTWKGFQQWAAGKLPDADEIRLANALWTEETRTNVALTADTAIADEGLLFCTRYLRLQSGIGFYAEIDGPAEDLPRTLQLGGDRRLARVMRLQEPARWPQRPQRGAKCVALALTPTILPEGRCPAAWREHCEGLAIPGADPLSGWDLIAGNGAGAPRPTRWALRPGSVWYLAQSSDLTAIGNETDAGFGWLAFGNPLQP